MDNGQKTYNLKSGEVFSFDGMYAVYKGEKGQARSLVKASEWFESYDGEVDPEQGAKVEVPEDEAPVEMSHNRNITGGKIIESSDVPADTDARAAIAKTREKAPPATRKASDDSLESLVEQYDNASGETIVTDDMEDAKSEVRAINADADIVAEVSQAAKEASSTGDTSGVQMSAQEKGEKVVVAMDDNVAKETNYSGAEKPEEQGHLPVESDGDGVVVKKTSAPAINKNEVNSSTVVESNDSGPNVSAEEKEVAKASEPATSRGDIGSSTQTRKTSTKSSKSSSKSKATRDAGQDGVVVGKVSKQNDTVTSEGITSKVSVGAEGQVDTGDVEFSAPGGMEVGEVEVTSGEDSVADLGGGSVDSDADIDINDLLQ
ncbi:MAG: hypothetical protein GF334_06735 [Candidatus Altiarchaeales archaeon]|nr:hypothetical protein [Candidatus Altiarchaeales archaeon]